MENLRFEIRLIRVQGPGLPPPSWVLVGEQQPLSESQCLPWDARSFTVRVPRSHAAWRHFLEVS